MVLKMLEEITNGYDGLIRTINFPSFKKVVIEIAAMKKTTQEWVCVRFDLEDLTEFAVRQKLMTDNTVLSNGIACQYIGDIYYIAFSPYSTDMKNIDDFRKSDVYFAAHKISFKVNPYSE